MAKTWKAPSTWVDRSAPGTCTDCGGDAYIRMAAHNGTEDMLCAHCYADRARKGLVPKPREAAHSLPGIDWIRRK